MKKSRFNNIADLCLKIHFKCKKCQETTHLCGNMVLWSCWKYLSYYHFSLMISEGREKSRLPICLASMESPVPVIHKFHQTVAYLNRITGFDINGCPIARGKWNASSGKWKRHPTCPIGQVKMILWYVQFLKSKMINIELFSVGSRGEFYLNNASYISCIFTPFCFILLTMEFPFLK